MNSVLLTDDELAMLDGKVSRDDVQDKISAAIKRIEARTIYADLSDTEAGLIADILTECTDNGRLIFHHSQARHCSICDNKPDPLYVLYKSGPRKGTPNYDKPRYLNMVELADRFVRMKGSVALGCCRECWGRIGDAVKEALVDTKVELPMALLASEDQQKFERFDNRHCKECGWVGHEGEMGRLSVLMGGGSYPGECPNCDARNLALGRTIIEKADGFVVKEIA